MTAATDDTTLNMDEEFFHDCHTSKNRPVVLIVGDGDFSFSLAFCKRYDAHLTCSTIESPSNMVKKYPNYVNTVRCLKELGKMSFI